MATYYAELWVAFIFTIVAYVVILIKLNKNTKIAREMMNHGDEVGANSTSSPAERRLILKTLIYALIFVVCWVPATANRLIGLTGGKTPFEINLLHTIFVPGQGFLNAINFFVFLFLFPVASQSQSHTPKIVGNAATGHGEMFAEKK